MTISDDKDVLISILKLFKISVWKWVLRTWQQSNYHQVLFWDDSMGGRLESALYKENEHETIYSIQKDQRMKTRYQETINGNVSTAVGPEKNNKRDWRDTEHVNRRGRFEVILIRQEQPPCSSSRQAKSQDFSWIFFF